MLSKYICNETFFLIFKFFVFFRVNNHKLSIAKLNSKTKDLLSCLYDFQKINLIFYFKFRKKKKLRLKRFSGKKETVTGYNLLMLNDLVKNIKWILLF